MAENTVITLADEGNTTINLPVVLEQEEVSPYLRIEERIQNLLDDYDIFQGKVQGKLRAYHRALSSVTSDLYKDVFMRVVENDATGFSHDDIFCGWHNPGYQACDNVRSGLEHMGLALRQARAYAKAMQRSDRNKR